MRCSFVIPVFATERYLPRCLDSLVAQTDGDFEAIVVDDCSPGNCREIVERYDGRFRYFRQDRNRSAYQARARAVCEARGEYVVALDPDDYVLPNLVSDLMARARGADVVSYNLELDTEGVVTPHWCRFADEACDRAQVLEKLRARRMQWNLCGKAIRREVFLRAQQKSLRPDAYINASDDYAAFLPVVMEATSFQFLSLYGYRYWQCARSTSHAAASLARTWRAVRQTLTARRLALDFLRTTGDSAAIACARELARAIIRWMVLDYAHAVKKRGTAFLGHAFHQP